MRPATLLLLSILGCCGLTAIAEPRHDPAGSETTTAPMRTRIVGVGTPADDLTVFASRHYHIHTNLSRSETVPYGRHMDQVYAQFERRFADYSPRNTGPMPLYLFRHQSDYLKFMQRHGIAAEGTGGMFFVTHSLQGLATWTHGHRRSQTLRTLQHEGFHQFAWNHLGPNLPTWMNEGLAQYFEDAVILDHGMELGLADPDRVALVRDALKFRWSVHLDELMAMNSNQWTSTLRHDTDRSELLYAQAWSIVYYMIHGDDGRYVGSFEVYLRLLSEGHPHEHAFRSAFGYGAEPGIENRWQNFAATQRVSPVSVAVDRMKFLGSALAYKHGLNEKMPRSFSKLRQDLQGRGFKLTRHRRGSQEELDASDDDLFRYTRPGGQGSAFLLLEPAGFGLPPRLAAPGLSPEPNLVWERDGHGQLVFDIEYR